MHIIMIGNPGDGFYAVGPFEDVEDALRYMEAEFSRADMWIMELQAPASAEGEDFNPA